MVFVDQNKYPIVFVEFLCIQVVLCKFRKVTYIYYGL